MNPILRYSSRKEIPCTKKIRVVDDSFASVRSFNMHPRFLHYDTPVLVNIIVAKDAICLRKTFYNNIREEVTKPLKILDDLKIE